MKKNLYKRQRHGLTVRRLLLISGGILLLAVAFFIFKFQSDIMHHPLISAHVAKAEAWVSARKDRIKQEVEKVKQLTSGHQEPPPPIRFEFYTSLPNMRIEPTIEKQQTTTRVSKTKL